MSNKISGYSWRVDSAGFLDHFKGRHIFVAMNDRDHGEKPWHLHDGWDSAVSVLMERQMKGWGAFFTVNELHRELDAGKKRTGKMWVGSRAVFMDDDNVRDEGDPRVDFPLEPSLIVETSAGKFHYYWLIDQESVEWTEEEKLEWMRIQVGLIEQYQGDKNARDLARYLRLPGSVNCKNFGEVDTEDMWEVRWMGDGRKYGWAELVEKMPKIKLAETRVTAGGNLARKLSGDEDHQKVKSRIEMINEIKSGTSYHDNTITLSYQLKQDGYSDEEAVAFIQGLFQMVPDSLKDSRWRERYDDITRCAEGAKKEHRGIRAQEIEELSAKITSEEELRTSVNDDIPLPPGLLGGLVGEAYDMAIYQYHPVALVSAVGLVAGICGRKFNVGHTKNAFGLNVYFTLIMNTGMGKDSISTFVDDTLMSLNEYGAASSFIGCSRYTGPKALLDDLKNARSKVCVFSEAGLLLKSKAGDPTGLGRVLLTAYTKSGAKKYTGGEGYSDAEKGLPKLRAPALTIINEATPETLHSAFKEISALEVGHLPRQSIFRITGKKPYANFEARSNIQTHHFDRLKALVNECSDVQAVEDPKVHVLSYHRDVYQDAKAFEKEMTDIQNDFMHTDIIRSAMASRAYVKAAKYAGIATVYNKGPKDEMCVVIESAEWEWAKALVQYEMDGIDRFFQGSGNELVEDDLVRRIVAPLILKLVKGDLKITQGPLGISKQQKERGEFKAVHVRQCLKGNKEMNDYALSKSSRFKATNGVDLLLEYMTRGELIHKVTDNPEVYVMTKNFRMSIDKKYTGR